MKSPFLDAAQLTLASIDAPTTGWLSYAAVILDTTWPMTHVRAFRDHRGIKRCRTKTRITNCRRCVRRAIVITPPDRFATVCIIQENVTLACRWGNNIWNLLFFNAITEAHLRSHFLTTLGYSSMFHVVYCNIASIAMFATALLSLSRISLMWIAIKFVSFSFFLLFCEINFCSIALRCLFLRSCVRFSHMIVTFAGTFRAPIHRSDVDECLERNVCPSGGCQNTIGSYICIREKSAKNAPYEACPPGYEWQPSTGVCAGNKKQCLSAKSFAYRRSRSYKLNYYYVFVSQISTSVPSYRMSAAPISRSAWTRRVVTRVWKRPGWSPALRDSSSTNRCSNVKVISIIFIPIVNYCPINLRV